MERVFLDANVLYSAAYLECSSLGRLTSFDDIQLLSSAYAIEEARRNLAVDRPDAMPRLARLLSAVSTIDAPQGLKLPDNIRLEAKDAPILLAAIHGRADYRLTGDGRHFCTESGSSESWCFARRFSFGAEVAEISLGQNVPPEIGSQGVVSEFIGRQARQRELGRVLGNSAGI